MLPYKQVTHIFQYKSKEIVEEIERISQQRLKQSKRKVVSRIPVEIWKIIFSYYSKDFRALVLCSGVCQEWKLTIDYSLCWFEINFFSLPPIFLRINPDGFVPVTLNSTLIVEKNSKFPLGIKYLVDIQVNDSGEENTTENPLTVQNNFLENYDLAEKECLAYLYRRHLIDLYLQYSKYSKFYERWDRVINSGYRFLWDQTNSSWIYFVYLLGIVELWSLFPFFLVKSDTSSSALKACGFAVIYLFLFAYFVVFLEFAALALFTRLSHITYLTDHLPWNWSIASEFLFFLLIMFVALLVILVQAGLSYSQLVITTWCLFAVFSGISWKYIRAKQPIGCNSSGGTMMKSFFLVLNMVIFLAVMGGTFFGLYNDRPDHYPPSFRSIGTGFLLPILLTTLVGGFLGLFVLFTIFLIPRDEGLWIVCILSSYHLLCCVGAMYSSVLLITQGFNPSKVDDTMVYFSFPFLIILLANAIYGGLGTGFAIMAVGGAAVYR
jgi:hypothetical protein